MPPLVVIPIVNAKGCLAQPSIITNIYSLIEQACISLPTIRFQ